jgi:hypothetical protein
MACRNAQASQFSVVQLPRHLRALEYPLDAIPEYELRFASPVKERAKADMIPATKKTLESLVPYCEGKLPQKKVSALLSPFRIGRKKELDVVGNPHREVRPQIPE